MTSLKTKLIVCGTDRGTKISRVGDWTFPFKHISQFSAVKRSMSNAVVDIIRGLTQPVFSTRQIYRIIAGCFQVVWKAVFSLYFKVLTEFYCLPSLNSSSLATKLPCALRYFRAIVARSGYLWHCPMRTCNVTWSISQVLWLVTTITWLAKKMVKIVFCQHWKKAK